MNRTFTKKPLVEETVVDNCPPHSWDYSESNQMYCKRCSQLAGSFTTNNGDYGV